MTSNPNSLSFRVSAGLKNIIGRDLISDKMIAIFEKNVLLSALIPAMYTVSGNIQYFSDT